jgi:hypothetical protein
VSIVAPLLLTACSPEVEGGVALTRDDDGELAIVLAACGASYDAAKLSTWDEDVQGYRLVAFWTRNEGVDDLSVWQLSNPKGSKSGIVMATLSMLMVPPQTRSDSK